MQEPQIDWGDHLEEPVVEREEEWPAEEVGDGALGDGHRAEAPAAEQVGEQVAGVVEQAPLGLGLVVDAGRLAPSTTTTTTITSPPPPHPKHHSSATRAQRGNRSSTWRARARAPQGRRRQRNTYLTTGRRLLPRRAGHAAWRRGEASACHGWGVAAAAAVAAVIAMEAKPK